MSDTSVDTSRRTAPPPPPPPPAAPVQDERTRTQPVGDANEPRGLDAAARTRDVVASSSGLNELRGGQGQDLLGTGARIAHPALPTADAGADLDAPYRDAGATPPPRATDPVTMPGTEGTPADRTGHQPTAADAVRGAQNQRETIAALGRRAGVDTSRGTGRMDPATIARRADHISWSLQNRQPVHGPDGPVQIQMSAQERAALEGSDPQARRQTADDIGRRVATQEAFERAVGGADNARKIEQAYQASTPEQRDQDAPQIDRAANAERLARGIEIASLAFGVAGLARGLLARGLARLGVGAVGRASLQFTERALQKGFTKHGADFGKRGNWNPSRAAEFRDAVTRHINTPGVRQIEGTYRGQQVTHYLDPRTGLNVMADRAGNYVSGWRLGADQLRGVLERGRLF